VVGEKKIYQGQVVDVVYQVNGDEFVIQFPNGERKADVPSRELSDLPKPASNRPIITKGAEGQSPEPPAGDVPPVVPPVEPPKTEDAPPVAPEAPAAPVMPASPEAPQA